jgi:hypothetical protein
MDLLDLSPEILEEVISLTLLSGIEGFVLCARLIATPTA